MESTLDIVSGNGRSISASGPLQVDERCHTQGIISRQVLNLFFIHRFDGFIDLCTSHYSHFHEYVILRVPFVDRTGEDKASRIDGRLLFLVFSREGGERGGGRYFVCMSYSERPRVSDETDHCFFYGSE